MELVSLEGVCLECVLEVIFLWKLWSRGVWKNDVWKKFSGCDQVWEKCIIFV